MREMLFYTTRPVTVIYVDSMKTYRRYQTEVEKHVLAHRADPTVAAYIARYVGGVKHEKRKPDEQSRLRYHGLTVPKQRGLSESGFSFAGDAKEFEIWDFIYQNSDFYETKSFAFHYLKKQKRDFRHENWPTFKNWVNHVDNWAHSDELSQFYAEMLEQNFKGLKSYYEKMGKSKNPWVRRQSVVGMLFYSRFRKKAPPIAWMLKQIKNLLDDPHYYVQKGVGWALREVHNLAPETQEKFVKTHLQHISPTAWYAASENYSVTEKKRLAQVRKEKRKESPSKVQKSRGGRP